MAPQFAWASGYGPLDEMPFLEFAPPLVERLRKFWEINRGAPGASIDPGGRIWPDLMGCGLSNPSFFVSENVIDDMAANGIPVWRKTEMPIAGNRSKALQNKKAPRYFVVEVEPGISVDFEASGVAVGPDGRPVLTREQRTSAIPMILDLSTWSGADLFCYSNWRSGSRLDLLCTEKVKRLAEKEKWTNIFFKPQPVIGTAP